MPPTGLPEFGLRQVRHHPHLELDQVLEIRLARTVEVPWDLHQQRFEMMLFMIIEMLLTGPLCVLVQLQVQVKGHSQV